MRETRELARITYADIGAVYEGIPGLVVNFEYEDGGGQYLSGHMIDPAMVCRFMNAVGVSALRDAEGKSCWVTHTDQEILKVEPLHAKDGRPFDLEEWKAWMRQRIAPLGITYAELADLPRP